MNLNYSISKSLRDIADKELLTSLFMNDYSLMNGKMGRAVFFALLSRVTGNHWYEDFAGELVYSINQNITNQTPINFANGLCGIGWGIEFLKYRGFIDENTDDILSEIDIAVMERDIRRITDESLETGIRGILAYVICRLLSSRDTSYVPFDEAYLSNFERIITKLKISKESIEPSTIWCECVRLFSLHTYNSWKRGISILEHELR